jgi:hypothetical protein
MQARSAVGCRAQSTREQVLAALYSIYYREEQARSRPLASGWPPLPLETAAEFLRCDPDGDVRRARIRRAAISLSSGIVLLRCIVGPSADVSEFTRALAILGVGNLLVDELARRVSCAEITSSAKVEDTAGVVIDTTMQLQDLQRSCCPCVTECTIGPWGRISVAEFRIEVNRDSSCIFQTIDPQCWDDVVPANFDDSFVVQPACASNNTPACRTTTPCTMIAAPMALSPAPTPTNPWCGLLSETALAAAYDITSRLETVLKVRTTQPSQGELTMDYGLCESRTWTICNPACLASTTPCTPVCTSGNCAVERDCGFADVQPATGGSVLFAQKQLLFSGGLKPDMNGWAQLALKVMVGEVADATCRPPSACVGAPAGVCTTTTLAGTTPSTAQAAPCDTCCTCKGPVDSCTLVQEMTPTKQPPFCPAAGGLP